jgi:hypothetical protein
VWTGQYQSGITWLGLERGDIALLATSNRFSRDQLINYAATKICK